MTYPAARLALEENEQMYRTIFETSLEPTLIIDLETGRFIEVNAEELRNSGFTREEIVGVRTRDIELHATPEGQERMIAELRKHGEVRNLDLSFMRKDGSQRAGLLSAHNVMLRGHLCTVTTNREIAALKETQHQLTDAREQALSASHAKSEFLSSMSHEIRTPMNAVLGMADLLAESDLTLEQRRFLDVMIANGNSLMDLINSILDLAKIESGRMQMEQTEFDLSSLVDQVISMFGPRAHGKGLELGARIAPGVPEHLVGDSLRLRQILVNLLGNALKFTEFGEIVLAVENNPESEQPGALRFSVRDTGIGVAADKLESIFSSFTQADSSTTRRYGGTGLGLAIVQRLVGLMDGKIWIESELRTGSTFLFTASFGLAARVTTAAFDALPELTRVKTLIVDDNATNRLIAREMISSRGAEVTEAASGEDALAAIRTASHVGQPFQLVLLDLQMPGMDGFGVARQIRLEPNPIRPVVLMLSSDDLKPQISGLHDLGLEAYLVKPITRKELFQSISAAMGMAHRDAAKVEVEQKLELSEKSLQLPPVSILVAEDSPDNRLVISAFLRRTPCKLDFAEDGKIAFDKFTAHHYDLVFMDMHMPVMDGYAATRAIRQFELDTGAARTPIVALTASVFEDAAKRVREAGCDDHVSKPVKKVTLLETIRKYALQTIN